MAHFYIHIDEIEVTNFRVFREKTSFKLAPLTILTGPNNSGKSTLSKLLRLLKTSSAKYKLRKLDLSSDQHGLGGPETIFNAAKAPNDQEKESLSIEFLLNLMPSVYGDPWNVFQLLMHKIKLTFTYRQSQTDPSTIFLRQMDLAIGEEIIYQVQISDENALKITGTLYLERLLMAVAKKVLQEKDNLKASPNHALSKIRQEDVNHFDFSKHTIEEDPQSHLYQFLSNVPGYMDHSIEYDSSDAGDDDYIESYNYDSYDRFHSAIFNEIYDVLDTKLMNLGDTSLIDLKLVPDKYHSRSLKELLNPNFTQTVKQLENDITNLLKEFVIYCSNLDFVGSQHISPSRVIHYGDKVDSGTMQLLVGMLQETEDKKKLERWIGTNGFNVGDSLQVEEVPGLGYKVFLKDGDLRNEIQDFGTGTRRLIQILAKGMFRYGLLFIEEPELSMHPNYQSKLADFFVSEKHYSNKTFIIETHSEYLIRKLQTLVARGEISKDHVALYYFHKEGNTHSVKQIHLNEKGTLSESFGPGFFDEADNIAIELFELGSSSKN